MKESTSRLGLGISLLVLGLILLSGTFKSDEVLDKYTFAKEPVEVKGFDFAQNGNQEYPQKIIIPELSIDLEVAPAKIVDGYWEVSPNKANWGEGSGIPGNIGNQVIFAHAKKGLFLPLRGIKKDMKIYVFTKNNWFSYYVKEIKEVVPSQIEVIAPTEDETLTLYTCSGFQDSKRLIVIAKRI